MANDSPIPRVDTSESYETLTLKNGYTLAYARYGVKINLKTIPVFYFNGTPSSRLECSLLDEAGKKLGVPLIGTDRPGFGRSSFQNRKLLDWPRDVLELADHLGIPKFGVIGLSGGGPHVLACLYEIPRERLVAATVVSGMCPMTLGAKDMMWPTWMLFSTARYSTWVVETMFELSLGKTMRRLDEESLAQHIKGQSESLPLPEVDKAVMREMPEDEVLRAAFVAGPKEALKSSCKGAAWEMYLLGSDWGFRIEDLDADRLTIWHGDLDVNCPFATTKKVSELLPRANFRPMHGYGHMSVMVRHRHEILSELVERL